MEKSDQDMRVDLDWEEQIGKSQNQKQKKNTMDLWVIKQVYAVKYAQMFSESM